MIAQAADLIGPALDWAVAMAVKAPIKVLPKDNPDGRWAIQKVGYQPGPFWPSQDWSQCGPLIESNGIKLECSRNGSSWHAGRLIPGAGWNARYEMFDGEDPDGFSRATVAACRAIVVHKIGHEIDIPEDLL